ncbi:VLTF-2 late transcription factor 2 [Mythimna separata entomopoxvirus 'L']|uniref:VLTF-2 late transcription factor 2 n=1 Tax=Mythimna separata entomopoxvirus 'L' TaxID=1293572 RepID=A0A916KQ40_9POXV|nr:VLTF-2 late transcription factor 2 [Mythimna separata entomopoxvirus 'L']CCU56270.1 VLTF-2 late transcription factor 2 [Mythimna separata entomopoxvirus 'L']
MFKTDITDEEVAESAKRLIKNYICNFYKIEVEKTIEIIEYKNKCIYCGDHADEITINNNNINIGYFCSDLCKTIYYSIIRTIFNLPITNVINFIPYYLLCENSKNNYKKLKDKISKHSCINISIFSEYKNNNIKCDFIILTNEGYIKYNVNFNHITDSNLCIYCNIQDINDDIYIKHINGIIKGFCSKLCRDSISKQIYTTILPIYKYNSYLIPYELVKDKEEFISYINHVKNNDNLYGGYYPLLYNKSKIELFTTT